MQCKFWTDALWNEHKKSKKGTTAVGQEVGKRGRKARGTNTHTHAFLENVDGTPANAREYEVVRQWGHDLLDICIHAGVDLPASWKDVDIRIKQLCYEGLRAVCPRLQCCDRNYKAKVIMSGLYYEDHGRNYNKDAKRDKHGAPTGKKGVKLEHAPYTILDPDELTGHEAHPTCTAPAIVPKSKVRAREADPSSDLEYMDDVGTMSSDPESNAETGLSLSKPVQRQPAAESKASTRMPSKRSRDENTAPVVPKKKTKLTRSKFRPNCLILSDSPLHSSFASPEPSSHSACQRQAARWTG